MKNETSYNEDVASGSYMGPLKRWALPVILGGLIAAGSISGLLKVISNRYNPNYEPIQDATQVQTIQSQEEPSQNPSPEKEGEPRGQKESLINYVKVNKLIEVPTIKRVEKIVEIPVIKRVEKIVEIPRIKYIEKPVVKQVYQTIKNYKFSDTPSLIPCKAKTREDIKCYDIPSLNLRLSYRKAYIDGRLVYVWRTSLNTGQSFL